jgi:ribosomal protein S27AE
VAFAFTDVSEPRGGLTSKEVIEMYDIGEKPGIGRYCCTNCGWSVNLDDASDRLPPCGSCGKGQHTKYNRC